MNLKEFSNKYVKKVKENVEKTVDELEEKLKEENIDEFDDVKSMYDKYSGMPKGDLENELFETIKTQKENGTFNKAQIESTYQMLQPMLNQEQRERLEHYMKMIL
ncbi:MAG: hypothetical protein CVV59_01520 [Tenericutes bacterium HGW-Tenericutes-4]|nr:MAG: hypothetical protein CVV59_01520 [Tenericutes bacterium HGW-Tenericutes-4]